MIPSKHDDLSTAQLLVELITDVRTLIRQEVALARAEMREELARALVAAGLIAIASAALAAGGLWILFAATRTIAYVFNWPLSAVFAAIGFGLGIIGVALLAVAWRQVRTLKLLPKTRETIREHAHRTTARVHDSG